MGKKQKSKFHKKQTKGITLIALVITIIVLLILAGVTISTLTNQNSILKKANTAKEKMKIAEYEEELKVIGFGLQPDRVVNNKDNQVYMNEYEEEIRNDSVFEGYQEISQFIYLEDIVIQIITKEGYVFWVTEEEVKYIGGEEEIPLIPQKNIYASLKGNVLSFSDREEIAKENAENENYCWNITEQQYKRTGWGANAQVDTPWFSDREKIEVVSFKTVVQPTNMDNYFCYLTQLKTIEGIENLKTNAVTSMNGTFYNCTNLEELNVSGFNTRKVTSMNAMFANCSKLTTLNVSNFTTNQVTDMNSMFAGCKKMQELNLSNFNTQKVNNMGYMFQNCIELKKIELGNLDTTNVTTMIEMFSNCSALTELDLSNFHTDQVENMQNMFLKCTSLVKLNVSNFNTKNVNTMYNMFNSCSSLSTLDLSKWNVGKVTNMEGMFFSCEKLENMDCSHFDTSSVTNMASMFANCKALKKLNVLNFNTSKVTNMTSMFQEDAQLTELDLSSFDTNAVTNMSLMFGSCGNLTTIYVGNKWKVAPTDTDMFKYCGVSIMIQK